MKIYSTIIILILSMLPVFGQEQLSNREKADAYFESYQYARAVMLYQKLVDTKTPQLHDMERLAYSFYQINEYELSSNWYSRVVNHPESEPENLRFYAASLKQISSYEEAKSILQQYAEKTGRYEEVALEIQGCNAAIAWMANPQPFNIKNEKEVNTGFSEFAAFPIGNHVYYTGEVSKGSKTPHLSWTGKSFLKVYKADHNVEGLQNSVILEEFNEDKKYHVGPVSSDKAGKEFFVTRTYAGKDGERVKEGKKRFHTNRLELFIYTKSDQGWESISFAYNNVKEYSIGHAVLSPDEQLLYFASDMPGGKGGTDIWFSEKQSDGSWGIPRNAGNAINSIHDEMFPSLAPDGTLYYASDGFIGMGGLDIFKSKGQKENWTQPENLKYPMNSGGDDFAFVINKEQENQISGFFTSNRSGGAGNDDIYAFNYTKPKIVVLLEGITFNGEGNTIPLSEVNLSLFDENRTLLAKKQSVTNGMFEFEIEPNVSYKVLAQKGGFYSDSVSISTNNSIKSDTLRVNLHLIPLFEVGKKFVLEDIHYDFDKHNIRSDAALILNELVRIMRDNPTLTIELSSHTDSRGSDNYNRVLSERRAKSAVDYLVSRGIERDRMEAKGYGETQLLNECDNNVPCSKDAHQKIEELK